MKFLLWIWFNLHISFHLCWLLYSRIFGLISNLHLQYINMVPFASKYRHQENGLSLLALIWWGFYSSITFGLCLGEMKMEREGNGMSDLMVRNKHMGPCRIFTFSPSFLPLPNLLSDLSVLRTLPVFGDPSFHIFGGKLTTNLYEILCLTNVEMPSCPPSSWLFNNRAAPFIIK